MSDTRLILFVSLIVTLLFVTAMVSLAFVSAGRDIGLTNRVPAQPTATNGFVATVPDQTTPSTELFSYPARSRVDAVVLQDREAAVDAVQESEPPAADTGEVDMAQRLQPDNKIQEAQVEQQSEQQGEQPREQKGDQMLAGRVVNQAGQAIAGAVVAIRLIDASDSAAQTLTTDRAGGFALNNLQAGDYLIRTRATATYPSVSTTARSGVTTVTLTVKENSQLSVQGLIRDAAGQPLAGVEVATPDGRASATSDSLGRYRASLTTEQDQPAVLTFSSRGFVESSQSIAPRPKKTTGSIRLDVTLQRLGDITLSGQVTDEQLNPIDQATVMIVSQQHGLNLLAKSNASGEYFVDGLLQASDYQIQVSKMPEFEVWKRTDFDISGSTALNVPLDSAAAGRVWGYLTNLDGQPILNKTFTAIGGDLARSIKSGAEDGFYEFHTVADRVSFTYGNSVPKVELIGPAVLEGDDIQLDLKINTGNNSISGKVLSTDGVAVPTATVDLVWQQNTGALFSKVQFQDQTDSEGGYSFSGLGSGTWALTVTAPGYGGSTLPGVDPQLQSQLPPITLTRQ